MSKLILQQICPQQLQVTGDICMKILCEYTDTETADLPSCVQEFDIGRTGSVVSRNLRKCEMFCN